MKDARTYVERDYSHFFTGEYDRAEGDVRTAMRFNRADQNVKEELPSLARVPGVLARMGDEARDLPVREKANLHFSTSG